MSCELYPVDFCFLQDPGNRLPCISVTEIGKDSMSEQYNLASYNSFVGFNYMRVTDPHMSAHAISVSDSKLSFLSFSF